MTPPIPAPYLRGVSPLTGPFKTLQEMDAALRRSCRQVRMARRDYELQTGELIEPEPVTDPDQYDAEQKAARC